MWNNLDFDIAMDFASFGEHLEPDTPMLFRERLRYRRTFGLLGQVGDVVRNRSEVTTREIAEVLELPPIAGTLVRIGGSLTRLGWRRCIRKRADGVQYRFYERPGART